MLTLTNITKDYLSGDNTVHALKSVSLSFGKSEFVSILGPSGCGKTTLLNIIGGLDRYTSGEMAVAGVPTSDFRDRDWDTYRNHSIGFVFQSYNLIPHQTVLANVELALTLSGVGKAERRKKAEEALRKVGLGDQLKKKPSQMSGGQMQRVAIARALVNDPEILLADEPTGALDSETSVQIMELLQEVARDKLVIMVTHNPELAERYSTRIIRLLDGKIVSDEKQVDSQQLDGKIVSDEKQVDSQQLDGKIVSDEDRTATQQANTITNDTDTTTDPNKTAAVEEKYKHKTSMSYGTALGLSLKNLMTKKGRTLLVAFAGSIGIIGIALILSLSNGINEYIAQVQEDTLSTYPIQIVSQTTDMSGLMEAIAGARGGDEAEIESRDRVYANTMLYELLNAMTSAEVRTNNLSKFKTWLDDPANGAQEQTSAIRYGYGITPQIYAADTTDGVTRLNPTSMFDSLMPEGAADAMSSGMAGMSSSMTAMMATSGGMDIWQEMIDNQELMEQQYEVIAGRWPTEKNEVVLVLDSRNEINDVYLYALGFKDQDEVPEVLAAVMKGEEYTAKDETYSYDEVLNKTFKLLLPTDMYRQNDDGTWDYMGDNKAFMQMAVDDGLEIRIVGILKPDPEAVATSITGAIGYLPSLTEYVLNEVQNSAVVQAQLADETEDVLSGLPFDDGENSILSDSEKADRIRDAIAEMSAADRAALYASHMTYLSEDVAAAQAAEQLANVPADQLPAMLMAQMSAAAEAGADDAMQMDPAMVQQYLSSMSDEELYNYALTSLTKQIQDAYAAQAEQDVAQLSTEALAFMLEEGLAALDDAGILAEYGEYMPPVVSSSTYDDVLNTLGYANEDRPSSISIYTDTFEKKDALTELIADYNQSCVDDGRDDDVISYTDYVALMMSSISTIINVISYVLIAFVSISLVVSSIMIGIITYISVLERTKEIGILRAIGASKKDVSRVFNAETLIIGFAAGAIGIGVTLLLCIPANLIIQHLTDIASLARLPWVGGVALVCISMILTTIAGLVPSAIAAKKDPVESLRSE